MTKPKIDTYTINPNDPRTVIGTRQKARRVFREHGIAVWVRACGTRVTVFYRDEEGKRRQRSSRFTRLVLSEPVKPFGATA